MYIEKIKSPADLKKLDLKELQVVADETRQAVLNRVSKHGGHVGPNLGFVEATVALHYVFNAPKDKLVFDVSHQCYPHKVLTGRAAGFLGDVDDMNAISGYSSPAECPEYDNFEVGHTSTSVSLATGLQKARDIKGTDENIIAIIGDGSLSGGEAFEGLDEASELGTGIIIVVNDNEMSIAENHGGIYKNLRALRESNGTCEHNWFKAWGFEYKYLEEGNDIDKLIQVFESVKDTDKPTVVHIHTEKGHGFAPAVANKEAWHWGMPFNLEDGSRPRRNADGTLPEVAPTEDYGTLFSDWMLSEMKQDKTLIAVTLCTKSLNNLLAQCLITGTRSVTMTEDAYATKGILEPVWKAYDFSPLIDHCHTNIPLRHQAATDLTQVLDWDLYTESIQTVQENDRVLLRTPIRLRVTGYDKDGALRSETVTTTGEAAFPLAGHASCRLQTDGLSMNICESGGQLLADGEVCLSVWFFADQTLQTLCGGEIVPSQTPRLPELLVRSVERNSRLWDIAKQYGSTVSSIQAANDLQGATVPQTDLLLIPIG